MKDGKRTQFYDHEKRVKYDDDGNVESITECNVSDFDASNMPQEKASRQCMTLSNEICRNLELRLPTLEDVHKCTDTFKQIANFHDGPVMAKQIMDLSEIRKALPNQIKDGDGAYERQVKSLEQNPFGAYSFFETLLGMCKGYKKAKILDYDTPEPGGITTSPNEDQNSKDSSNSKNSKDQE
jgi:hypothetical protein